MDLDVLAPPGNASVNNSVANVILYNKDMPAYGYTNSMRYRHVGNRGINLLFADGHAESRTIGEVTLRMLCVNPQ